MSLARGRSAHGREAGNSEDGAAGKEGILPATDAVMDHAVRNGNNNIGVKVEIDFGSAQHHAIHQPGQLLP